MDDYTSDYCACLYGRPTGHATLRVVVGSHEVESYIEGAFALLNGNGRDLLQHSVRLHSATRS